jgi:hypothetical protein
MDPSAANNPTLYYPASVRMDTPYGVLSIAKTHVEFKNVNLKEVVGAKDWDNHTLFRLDLVQMFRYSYGIFIDFKSKPEEVVLSFTPDCAKYLKSQPFHEQQLDTKRILADNAKEFRVRFEFIINQELVMELARLGKEVKILAPESLRKEVELHHQQALQK